MSIEFHQSAAVSHSQELIEGVDDELIEAIWHELDHQLPRARVIGVVTEIALGFQEARVKTYLPIFVHRGVLERLRQELNEIVSPDDH